jgi:two-component system cell cycle sensor histidine kinase/response regulator CckA
MMASRERVLLVDDEPQVLLALEDLLADDYSVVKSETGQGALDVMASDHDIAVLITDQRMPRMSGDELLARLGDSSDAARIMITGYADLGAVIRAVNQGILFAYVTKPWNRDDLLLKVRRGVDHYRLTRELSGERRLFQDLMNNVPDGIYFKDTELRLVRVNQAFSRALGFDHPDSILGKRVSELIPSEAYRRLEAEERRLLARRAPLADVVEELGEGAAKRWYSQSKAPILDSQGKVIGLAGIVRDVSERIEMHSALQKSEQRQREQSRVLNSILSGMGEGAIVVDKVGNFLLFNQRAQKILGMGPEVAGTSSLAETYGLYTQDRTRLIEEFENPISRAMKGEELAETEVFVRNGAVPGANVALMATPLKGDADELVGSIALLRDVTQQRKLEQDLFHARKMEAIGRLAGSVAHDFNNTLSVILSYSAMLLKDVKSIDPMYADLEAINRAGMRAAELTRQLLAFSRKQVLAPQVVDLNQVVREATQMLDRLLGEDIELVAAYGKDLARVRVDPGQIDQVVMNLCVNARDAMPKGGKLTLETKNVVLDRAALAEHADAKPGSYVMLAVSDTGMGMDKATQERIFEPFFTTKELGKGTGLGLATVFGIIKQSGGHVWVYSELGRGTTFKLYLPSTDAPPTGSEEPPDPTATLVGDETILLVEDQDDVRQVALHVLRRYGYRVIEARNAGEALLSCERHVGSIDLLLTDVVMPSMSGAELGARLLQIRPDMSVIYMSGYADSAIIHHGILDPGVQYLQKPLVPDQLARRVREVLDLRARRQGRAR